MSQAPVIPTGRCPICDADDAYMGQRVDCDEYFVECIECGVYLATRKVFRHFEYLRWRAESSGLQRLEQLAAYLNHRPRGTTTRLEYDGWQDLLDDNPNKAG
jgi:Zn ribbon nucleic-acid-binding protein